MSKNYEKKIAKLTFEEAMSRLEEIVETISSQKISLESMIELHEEGALLKEHCTKRLEEAQMKIETVLVKTQNSEQNKFN